MKRIIAALVVMMLLVTAGVGVYATDIVDIIEIDEATSDIVDIEEVEEVDEAELIADDFELAAEMPVYFEQDFSTWTDADLADVSAVTKGKGSMSVTGDIGCKFILTLDGGALSMQAKGTNSTDNMNFTAIDGLSGKNATISFKLKKEAAVADVGDTQRNIFITGSGSSQKVLMIAKDGTLAEVTGSHRKGDLYSTLTQPTTDKDGFYNIFIEFYMSEYKSADAWVIDMYDALTNNKFYSITYTKDKLGSGLAGFYFGSYRNSAARNDANNKIVFTVKDPEIAEMAEKPDLYITDISHKGGNFEPGTKKLELTFNKAVDTKTMDAGLSFTKADGSAIGGGVFYEFTSPNVLVIKFGRLPIGNYKLTIDEDLKNTDGGFAGDVEYVYNVTNAKDADYLVQDFSTWESADISEVSKGIGTAVISGTVGFKVPLTLNEDGSLTMQSKGANSTDNLDFVATDYIANQNAVTTFKLKGTTVDNMVKGVQRNINLCVQGSTSAVGVLRMNNDGSFASLNTSSIGSDAFTQPKKDDNGYYYIKINFYYGDFKGTEAWIAEFLDMNSNGQKFYGIYYAPTTFPTGLGGLGFGFYREKVDRDADTYVALTVKDLKIAQGGRRVFAIANDGEGAQPDVDAVTLIYDDTLPNDTFKDGNVKLLDGTTEIPITYEGDIVNRKLIVKPAEYLEYGKDYIIKVTAGDIVNTKFTTAKRPVSVSDVILADGVATVTLSDATEGEGSVILGIFDAEGKVIGYKIKPVAESVTFNEIPAEAKTIKVYATEKLDGYTRKACETFVYTIEDEA